MQELAFAQSPGFSGQQTQGPGDKARTLEGTSSLCKQKKVPVLQRERMIKGVTPTLSLAERKRNQNKSPWESLTIGLHSSRFED